MPVCSYLVYPMRGKKEKLLSRLGDLSGCETLESLNESVLVLVTDTPDHVQEGILQENLMAIREIEGMALVYAQEG